ncbi:unnamed protein product [Caenorhabditis angaria]|uniref:Uncharacterized protein n=1 Tax=Caenorhabditis angaria TaxID=860376 RepID=A0A9P1J062_9PELO|nr:unnamed protein product [Caenorhabditis angaria]
MEDRFTDTILRATNVQSAIERFEKRQPVPLPPTNPNRFYHQPNYHQKVEEIPDEPPEVATPLFINTITHQENVQYFPAITPPKESSSPLQPAIPIGRFDSFQPLNFGKTIQGIYNSTEMPNVLSPTFSVDLNVVSPQPPIVAPRKLFNQNAPVNVETKKVWNVNDNQVCVLVYFSR